MAGKYQNIAIIGAGITGLYLAGKLAKNGYKITIFEKREETGGKICSGLVSERIKEFVPIDSLIENKIRKCLIHFPKRTIDLGFRPVHLAINREGLSQNLARLAKANGAKIFFGHSVQENPENFDKIIGCDGALSRIREKAGLPRPFLKLGLQFFQQKKDFSEQVEVWPIRGGFCWKIPRGHRIEYGAIGSLKSVKGEFQKFCQNKEVSFKDRDLNIALVPQGLALPKSKDITLCGDAAGLTKPWSGGGIIWSLTAAELLLKSFPDFGKYRQLVYRFLAQKF